MNALQPGSVEKMSKERSRIAMMENISKFLEACKAYGLQNGDLFHPTDLFDGSSMSKVVYTVQVLGKTVSRFGRGPCLCVVRRVDVITPDLFDGSSMAQVVYTVHCWARR